MQLIQSFCETSWILNQIEWMHLKLNKFFVNNLSHFIVQCCMRAQLHLNYSMSSVLIRGLWQIFELRMRIHGLVTYKNHVTRLAFLVAFNFEKIMIHGVLSDFLNTTKKKEVVSKHHSSYGLHFNAFKTRVTFEMKPQIKEA